MNADSLRQIYEETYGPLSESGKKKNLTELAETLSKIAGHEPPWTWRTLNGIICGHKGFSVTKELSTAMEVFVAKSDGTHPLLPRLIKITAYSINGAVEPGSIITGKSIRCPGCLVWFVPYSNLQIYCSQVCPGRPPKRRREVRAKGNL